MGRKIPEILDMQEQKQLLNIFNMRYFNSRRNKIMIELFLCSGLRLSEMLDLQWKDINLMSGQLKVVQGKGKKDRILWVNEDMLNILRNWKIEQSNKYGVELSLFTQVSVLGLYVWVLLFTAPFLLPFPVFFAILSNPFFNYPLNN